MSSRFANVLYFSGRQKAESGDLFGLDVLLASDPWITEFDAIARLCWCVKQNMAQLMEHNVTQQPASKPGIQENELPPGRRGPNPFRNVGPINHFNPVRFGEPQKIIFITRPLVEPRERGFKTRENAEHYSLRYTSAATCFPVRIAWRFEKIR